MELPTGKPLINIDMNKLFLFLATILICSCSSDDDSVSSSDGNFSLNGQTRDLTRGYIVMPSSTNDEEADPRRFYIILTDGTITYQNGSIVYGADIHQFVDFNLYTDADNPGVVQQTTYDLWFNTSFDSAFIDHSSILHDVDINQGEPVLGTQLSSENMDNGQLNITQSGDNFTLAFSFSDANDVVTGNYSGPLTILNP